ncbi:MAG: DEAD/DEAH box helicase [Phycisphaerales bacterium]|nr:DEAD/DEAH box helicase [Phycisphaerales bacterium]
MSNLENNGTELRGGVLLLLTPEGALTVRPPHTGEFQEAQMPGVWHHPDAAARGVIGGSELLLYLAGPGLSGALPPVWAYWRDFAAAYVAALCQVPETVGEAIASLPPPSEAELIHRAFARPPMVGAEYLTVEVLRRLWQELDVAARQKAAAYQGGLSAWAHAMNPLWHRVGRVCFHLAENKYDPEYPFAFLATYAPGLSSKGKVQYVPLSRALTQYAGEKNRSALARLLVPVQAAAEKSALAKELVDSGEVFHPLAWSPADAYRFLRDIPLFEESGLAVRMPDWWKKRPRPTVQASIGGTSKKKDAISTLDEALSFDIRMVLGDEPLTPEEQASLLAGGDGLRLIRGQWVEVDKEKLQAALLHWREVKKEIGTGDGLSFLKAMRLLAGVSSEASQSESPSTSWSDWSAITADGAFADTLTRLRQPGTLPSHPTQLRATLRPYQQTGVSWLHFLTQLKLGACLADDMGLGKTIQVLSLLLLLKSEPRPSGSDRAITQNQNGSLPDGRSSDCHMQSPSLIVLPASLLGNWKAEVERFAPTLRTRFLHPAFLDTAAQKRLEQSPAAELTDCDVVFTSYAMAIRQPWLAEMRWRLLILDEAQAIKNPNARQTRFVKTLPADARIALTGTPVENSLSDLWSIFDFLNAGLLGGAKEFSRWVNRLEKRSHDQYAPLRTLTGPYILRRLKTDPAVAGDLPDKTELDAWCGLAKPQAILYARIVDEMQNVLKSAEPGIQRQGLVLAFLLRLKQICNHPAQGGGGEASEYVPQHSGKFQRLGALAEEIAARQEKVLIFTQFQEMTEPLERFLSTIFNRPGLILHGGVPVKARKHLVDAFQRSDGPPFFVLSLKAGGTGLNLTAATQVIHFDRWWNPAVENQATDRVYRIGQKRNVLVHKFICRGTVEERIDAMLKTKQALADGVLETGVTRLLTEMSDAELLRFVALDARRAQAED